MRGMEQGRWQDSCVVSSSLCLRCSLPAHAYRQKGRAKRWYSQPLNAATQPTESGGESLGCLVYAASASSAIQPASVESDAPSLDGRRRSSHTGSQVQREAHGGRLTHPTQPTMRLHLQCGHGALQQHLHRPPHMPLCERERGGTRVHRRAAKKGLGGRAVFCPSKTGGCMWFNAWQHRARPHQSVTLGSRRWM